MGWTWNVTADWIKKSLIHVLTDLIWDKNPMCPLQQSYDENNEGAYFDMLYTWTKLIEMMAPWYNRQFLLLCAKVIYGQKEPML